MFTMVFSLLEHFPVFFFTRHLDSSTSQRPDTSHISHSLRVRWISTTIIIRTFIRLREGCWCSMWNTGLLLFDLPVTISRIFLTASAVKMVEHMLGVRLVVDYGT